MADIGGGGSELFALEGKITIDTSKVESSINSVISSADELAGALDFDNASVSITSNAATVKSDIEGIDSSLDTIDGSTTTANIDADASSANTEIDTVDSDLDTLDSDTAEPTIDADASDASSEISTIDSDLDTLDGTSAEPTIDVDTGTSVSDVNSVEDEIKEVGEAADAADEDTKSFFDNIAAYATAGAVVAALAWVKNQFTSLVSNVADAGDRIDKESRRLTMSREAFQEWDYVISQSGGSISELGPVFKNLRAEMSAAEGPSEGFVSALEAIGLSVADLEDMSPEEQFDAITKGIADVDEETAGVSKIDLATALFGPKSAAGLMPLLETASEDIDALKERAHDLGLIMSDEDVDAAVAWGDTLADFQATIQSIGTMLSAEILGPMTQILGKITDWIAELKDPSLTEAMSAISEEYVTMMSDINNQEMEASGIIEAMAELASFDGLTEEQIAQWDAYKAKLEEIMPGVGQLFTDQAGEIKGGADALRAYNDEFFKNLKLQALQETIEKKQKALGEVASELIDMQIEQDVLDKKVEAYEEAQAENFQNLAKLYGLEGENYDEFLSMFTDKDTGEVSYQSAAYSLTTGYKPTWGPELAAGRDPSEYNVFWENDYGVTAPKQGSFEADQAQVYYDTIKAGNIDARKEAEEHRKELEDLNAEYETAQADFDLWLTSAQDLFGLSEESADDLGDAVDTATDDVEDGTDSIERNVKSMVDYINQQLKRIKSVTFKVEPEVQGPPEAPGHATGLRQVPYDNYLANLHKGERVLTRLEANRYEDDIAGHYGVIDYTEMANKIAEAVSHRPIEFSISGRELATVTSDEASRAAAFRYAQISNGYGRGA